MTWSHDRREPCRRVAGGSVSMPTRKAARKSSKRPEPLARTRQISRLEAARPSASGAHPKGRLILIGGAEDREGEMVILREGAARARGGRLAGVTAAGGEPEEMWALYRRVFTRLGVRDVVHVAIDDRDAAYDPAK